MLRYLLGVGTVVALLIAVLTVPKLYLLPAVYPAATSVPTLRHSATEVLTDIHHVVRLDTTLGRVITGSDIVREPTYLVWNGEHLRMHVEVVVLGGIALNEITQQDISIVDNDITITIPAATILMTQVDEDASYVEEHALSFFSKEDTGMGGAARRMATERARIVACQQGFLDLTQHDAETAIQALLTSLGKYRHVTIVSRNALPCAK